MRPRRGTLLASSAVLLLASTAGAQGAKPLAKCAPDAVVAGTVCMDKFEASVWRVPDPLGANKKLVKKIQQGKVTLADLTKGSAVQVGVASDDYAPCGDNGEGCTDDLYAVSLAGMVPSARATWFQAQAACENAKKRLPSSAEWQAAVIGTPDPGPDDGSTDCNTTSTTYALPEDPTPTGSRSRCVSSRGAFDMVGNLDEWVADWMPLSPRCDAWGVGISPTGDRQCFAGVSTAGQPGALTRGGDFDSGAACGPLAVSAAIGPGDELLELYGPLYGFRCAR